MSFIDPAGEKLNRSPEALELHRLRGQIAIIRAGIHDAVLLLHRHNEDTSAARLVQALEDAQRFK